MPIYEYICPHEDCDAYKEVLHSIAEIETPSESTIAEITCPEHGRMQKIISLPTLTGFLKGTSVPESVLLAEKKKQRKLRSQLEFKNTMHKNNKLTEADKKYFDQKLKNINGDHEKMK